MITTIRPGSPAEIIRGRTSTIALQVLDGDGDAVTLSAWSVSLTLAGQEIASSSGTGTASWSYAAPSTLTLGEGYLLDWLLTSGGRAVPHRQEAVVCLSALYPTVVEADITTRLPRLASTEEPLLSGDQAARVREAIAAAWDDVLDMLRSQGRRPHLILDARALRGVHIARTLEIILRGAASSLGGEYLAQSQDYGAEYRDGWRTVALTYAPDESASTGARQRVGLRGPLMAGGSWSPAYDHQRGRWG